jgi:DNA-binding NarL/FixJ family response regulator
MNRKTRQPQQCLNETRIMIVDDHEILRYGLKRLFQKQHGWTVCAEAWDEESALNGLYRTEPHIVILDITLEGGDGLTLTRMIRRKSPETRVVIYSMHDETMYAHQALLNGATGYVMKTESPDQLINAIHSILDHDRVTLSKRMNDLVLKNLCDIEDTNQGLHKLSDRERQVLRLIANGMTSREIALQLNRSIKTIETHRARIKTKLGISNSNKLLLRAIEIFKRDPYSLEDI